LTPLVLHVLNAFSDGEAAAFARKGEDYLASLTRPDGTIDPGPAGLSYPAYTAALTVLAFGRPDPARHGAARAAWLSFLQDRQLTERLGWQPSDREYGGWGYAHGLPYKPRPGEPPAPYTESNLSATGFAVEALRAAGCPPDDPAFTKALTFVTRCQNDADDPGQRDPVFDDGGFYFIYDDAERNKAGLAGTDRTGRPRFASYGSMTADGLRGLLACGLPLDHPRVAAAFGWLAKNFSASAHPGRFADGRAAVRASVYFYYTWSVARALTAARMHELPTPSGAVPWAEALADELLRRQNPDGSWVNDAVEVREDDPVVATSLTAGALVVCRQNLTPPRRVEAT
jgi:squalene-hopene/tetraprenyl-beta-curcumene cyclase